MVSFAHHLRPSFAAGGRLAQPAYDEHLIFGPITTLLECDVRGRPREPEQDADVGCDLEIAPQGDLA